MSCEVKQTGVELEPSRVLCLTWLKHSHNTVPWKNRLLLVEKESQRSRARGRQKVQMRGD